MKHSISRGMVVLVRLDPVEGHEQAGVRPAIVVSDPSLINKSRFPLVAVIPVTRTAVTGPFVVSLESGEGELRADSYGLIDQIRSLDIRRVLRTYALLSLESLARVEAALKHYLGLK